MQEVERFGDDSNIVFTMLNSQGIQGELYCPQPSFSRTKPILPLLRVMGDRAQEVSPITYTVDFEYILEEVLEVVEKRGYNSKNIKKCYDAWVKEFSSMSKCFNVASGEEIAFSDFIVNKKDKRDFTAWLTFFFILSRYVLREGIGEKGKMEYYTHLEFEDFKNAFMSYLEELELERQKEIEELES